MLFRSVRMPHQIHHATEAALAALGIAPEQRSYHPHVTLGRARRRESDVALPRLDLAPFRADAFHLYLSANGTYTKLRSYPLPS